MWITQERYPQAHSHNSKTMLSQLEGRKPSGRESNQEIAPSGPADGVHFKHTLIRKFKGFGMGDAIRYGAGSLWVSGSNIFRIKPPD
jgi:hypothetical protein